VKEVTEESKVMASHANAALGADYKFAGLLQSETNDDDDSYKTLLNEIIAGSREDISNKTPSDGKSSAEPIDTDTNTKN
jgi:hypothetical protein